MSERYTWRSSDTHPPGGLRSAWTHAPRWVNINAEFSLIDWRWMGLRILVSADQNHVCFSSMRIER